MSEVATLRDLRRSQIIQAARKIVAEEGPAAMTIGTLEERLPFSRGVITYHFQGKDEIVEAVLESAIQEIDSATFAGAQASKTHAEGIRNVMRYTIQGFLDHTEATLILLSFWSRTQSDPHAAEINARLHETYRRRSGRLLKEGIQAGAFRKVNIDAFATLMVGIVTGVVTQVYFDPKNVDAEATIVEACHTLVARLTSR